MLCHVIMLISARPLHTALLLDADAPSSPSSGLLTSRPSCRRSSSGARMFSLFATLLALEVLSLHSLDSLTCSSAWHAPSMDSRPFDCSPALCSRLRCAARMRPTQDEHECGATRANRMAQANPNV